MLYTVKIITSLIFSYCLSKFCKGLSTFPPPRLKKQCKGPGEKVKIIKHIFFKTKIFSSHDIKLVIAFIRGEVQNNIHLEL